MARRHRAEKREILPDPVYENTVVGRLISSVMERGKKSIAQKIVYHAIAQANKDNKEGNPLDILNKAVDTVKP
ncbi:MAG: 30S ribosomal protein S7, partial [Verrucomicrobiales bacterium]|nr:30S ribosomal protein S7 [Verrucomicrobiales bacterium]